MSERVSADAWRISNENYIYTSTGIYYIYISFYFQRVETAVIPNAFPKYAFFIKRHEF